MRQVARHNSTHSWVDFAPSNIYPWDTPGVVSTVRCEALTISASPCRFYPSFPCHFLCLCLHPLGSVGAWGFDYKGECATEWRHARGRVLIWNRVIGQSSINQSRQQRPHSSAERITGASLNLHTFQSLHFAPCLLDTLIHIAYCRTCFW